MSDQIQNKKSPLIIGINGISGAGKDTITDMVIMSLSSGHKLEVKKCSFAASLKEAASIIFGIPLVHFHDQSLKEVPNEFWGMSPRQMAQKLGTEACRNGIRDDIWIKSLEVRLNNSNADVVFVTDVRFNNEADFIYRNNGKVFNIFRNDYEKIKDSDHVSEQGIKNDYINSYIENFTGNPFVAAGVLQTLVLDSIKELK